MLQNKDQMLEMWRAAARSANAVANTLLSGTQRMLERQAEISREMSGECAEAAKQIETAADVQDLLVVQGRLARAQIEKTTNWWAALYVEIGIGQKELLRNAQASAQAFAESLSHMLDRVAPAPGTEPVMSAMKLVVDATRSSYAASTETGTTEVSPRMPAEPRQPSAGKGGGTRQASG